MSADRRSYNIAVSQEVQSTLTGIVGQLEALIRQRDADVQAAMADFQADGVSDQYADKERRWQNAANEVRDIVGLIRTTLERNDETARTALRRANNAVANI